MRLKNDGSPGRVRTSVTGSKTRYDGPLHYGTMTPGHESFALDLTGHDAGTIKEVRMHDVPCVSVLRAY